MNRSNSDSRLCISRIADRHGKGQANAMGFASDFDIGNTETIVAA